MTTLPFARPVSSYAQAKEPPFDAASGSANLRPSAVAPCEGTSMTIAMRCALLSVSFALTNAPLLSPQTEYATPILAGISNHGRTKGEPYVTAGDRAYLIGTQDGNFPDLGGHVPGEMGGLWLHSIKLIDGFWAQVTDPATRQDIALSKSTDFVTYPYGNRLRYGQV